MTFVKLEDARQAIKPRVGEEWSRDAMEAFEYADKMLQTAARIKGRSLPTDDGVTDEMVDVALRTWRQHLCFHTVADENGDPVFKSTAKEAMRAALQAALGPLPAPPSD